ncbi:hypothetical protein [Sphingomonas rubra]|uniref:Uncharacterized protein n=1 Tax=Sphingomonas rubra TaxID=634430 RepID=A0A1I5TC98_9SPHN|nr:hypothetical protein [Sphingomonas rubra]SFP80650.1 hypothetical protein SAMN04488241_107219 [Sphingomonas rubra]
MTPAILRTRLCAGHPDEGMAVLTKPFNVLEFGTTGWRDDYRLTGNAEADKGDALINY